MSEKKYTGFESYLTEHKFTSEFHKDYKYWAKRIFKGWTLFIDFDEFYSRCWEALLEKIDTFDPNIATIQTFCISRINNEARRFYMKNKIRRPEIDSDSPVIQNTLEYNVDETGNFEMFSDFVTYANSLGVKVNLKGLYEMYTEYDDKNSDYEPAPLIAFAAWRAMRKDIGGRNDIFKTKRRNAAKSGSEKQS